MTTRSLSPPFREYVQVVLAAYLELPETPARARSLYYFPPVIDQLLQNPLPTGYAEYLSNKVRCFTQRLPADPRH